MSNAIGPCGKPCGNEKCWCDDLFDIRDITYTDEFSGSDTDAAKCFRAQGAAAERDGILSMLKHEAERGPVGAAAACRYAIGLIERGDHAQPEPAMREDGDDVVG